MASISLAMVVSACSSRPDHVEQVTATAVSVPSMEQPRIELARPKSEVNFNQSADLVVNSPTPLPTPLPSTIPSVVPDVSPSPDPIVYVVGIGEGKHPSAALVGWSVPFVSIGDNLLDSVIVSIDMKGVTLSDGRFIPVSNAAAASTPTDNLVPNLTITPNAVPSALPTSSATATMGQAQVLPATLPLAPTQTLSPSTAAERFPSPGIPIPGLTVPGPTLVTPQ